MKRCSGCDGLRSRRSQSAAARALGLHGFGRGRQYDARHESRSLQTYTTPPAQTDRCFAKSTRAWSSSEPPGTVPFSFARWARKECFMPTARWAWLAPRRPRRALQILSTVTSHSVEDVIKARGGPVWYQLYAVSNWGFTEKDRQAGRRRRLPSAGVDHRPAGRPKHRDRIAFPPHRLPAMRRLPRRTVRFHHHQPPDVRRHWT